jgi:uncharacterized protein YndB with AHSA1/START domain
MQSDQVFRYTLHVAASADDVWRALTSRDEWAKYFPEWRPHSVWQPSAPLQFYTESGELYSTGEVLAAEAPRYLSYTWPEPEGEFRPELPERLTWRIEASGPDVVKVELTHDQLTHVNLQGVSQGWPAILSCLKTLLETGSPLKYFPK